VGDLVGAARLVDAAAVGCRGSSSGWEEKKRRGKRQRLCSRLYGRCERERRVVECENGRTAGG
jgi:hypothetical protein